jgi:hypothetical protein
MFEICSFFLLSWFEMDLSKCIMVKVPSKKQPIISTAKNNDRIIQLNAMPLAVQCTNPGKNGKAKLIRVADIRDIRRGQNTNAFELFGKDPGMADRSFSIIYFDGSKYGTLNLSKQIVDLIHQ